MQHDKTVIQPRVTQPHNWWATTTNFSQGVGRATAFISSSTSLHSAEEFTFHISTTCLLAPFSLSLLHLLAHLPQSPARYRPRCPCASDCASESAHAMQVTSEVDMIAFCLPSWHLQQLLQLYSRFNICLCLHGFYLTKSCTSIFFNFYIKVFYFIRSKILVI